MKKIAVLFACVLFVPAVFAQEVRVQDIVGEHWYGLYMNGQKTGHLVSRINIEKNGRVSFEEIASFKMNMAGLKQDMRIFSKRIYEADGAFVSIESKVDDIGGTNRFFATIVGTQMVLQSKMGGESKTVKLPKPEETLKDALKSIQLVRSRPEIGTAIHYSLFEPMYKTSIDATSTVKGVEERTLDGVPTRVYIIETFMPKMGIRSTSYITEAGLTLEDNIAGGILTMRLEPKAVALDVAYNNDVIVSNAARVDSPIKKPRTRDSLMLVLNGPLSNEHMFNDGRQRLPRGRNGFSFEGYKVNLKGYDAAHLPITDAQAKTWLEPTTFVQSDHPDIIAQAESIVGDETDTFRIVEKLSHWVYTNVQSTFSARLTNSLEVLNHMEGDCTEHSMLFIGLARAAGVPAREVAGLIYVDGPQRGFYFHQWAKVWVGKWIDVDPTFDQPIADATHIKLAEGDLFEQTKLLPIIGQIDIVVVEPNSN